jgi:hypothetical protein
LHILAAVQVCDQTAEGGGFEFEALLIGHDGLCAVYRGGG